MTRWSVTRITGQQAGTAERSEMDSKLKKHAAYKEGATRAKVVNRILAEMGFNPVKGARAEWTREIGDHLIHLQGTGDGTWWLTMACSKENPGSEFAGNFGQCIMQYAATVLMIQAGAFGKESG